MGDKRKNIIIRFGVVYLLIAVGFILVIYKIVVIQTVEREDWLKLQGKGAKTDIPVKPKRGNIYASDGRLMASSIPTYHIYMDMRVPALHEKEGKLFNENIDSVAICLSKLFKDKPSSEYKTALTNAYKRKDGRFSLYPKRIPYYQLKELQSLPLFRLGRYKSGLIYDEYVQRVKPFGSLASRTIGDVYADETKGGINGLERYYDKELTGMPGVAMRQKIANTWQESIIVEPVDGMDIITTIDIDIQDISEKALLDALKTYNAQSGYVILMETQTGEVKSIVNMQRNPNGSYSENWNGAVSDLMEPGSTFKIASLMVALDDGRVKMTDSIDTGTGIYSFSGTPMRDHNHHRGGYGKITVEEAIHASSNIGISRSIDEKYKKEPAYFIDKLYATKIADSLKLEIPGAAVPYIKHPLATGVKWSNTSLPWMSIGYELNMPPIYTLNFYNAIANDGKMLKPIFVKATSKDGQIVKTYKTEVLNRSICKSSTLKEIRSAMEGVVNGRLGTAKDAHSDQVKIAGKTGTAQMFREEGYKAGGVARYAVSFCGYFPADNPQYTGIVVLKDPRYAYTSAGLMSGKTFKAIAERTMALKSEVKPKDIEMDSISRLHILPEPKNGNYKALQTVMKNVRIPLTGESDQWVEVSVKENETHVKPQTIADNKIPNVRGMGMKDAVYVLESLGLSVQVNGRGKVVSQSITPGTEATKGRVITLELRTP